MIPSKKIKKEEKTHFFIKDEQSLYIADNNYFKDGTKKFIREYRFIEYYPYLLHYQ